MNAKKQKILSYSAAGLVALLAIVLIVPSFINWNQYKDEMKTILANATGRDIEIAGDLSFTLVPAPAFSASGVTIGNIEGGKAKHFANIKRVDIRISFMPLIRGRVDIKSLLLDTPLISLEKLDADTNNWTFGETVSTPSSTPSTRSNEKLKVDDFILQNGHLSYSDLSSGENYSFEGVSARIKASAANGPFDGNMAFLYKGIPVQAKGTIGAINKGRRTALNISAILNNERPGLSVMGSVLVDDTANDFTLRLRGEGKNLNALVTGLQTITGDNTDIPVNIQQNWDINSQIAKSGNQYSLTPTSFKIGKTSANLTLDYTHSAANADGNKAPDSSTLKLTINTIEGADWEKPTGSTNINATTKATSAPIKFSLPNNLTADMEVSIGALNIRDGLMRQIALRGKLDKGALNFERGQVMLPGGADIIASGTLTTTNQNPEFKGTIKASANNLRGTLGWAGLDLSSVPDGVLTGFSLNSGITANQQSLALYNAKGQLDISEFDLGFTLGLEQRTRFAVKGTVNRLNIDAYQKPDPKGSNAAAPLTERLNGFKNSLQGLTNFDARWDIIANRLNYKGATIEGLKSKGSLVDDHLTLSTLAIQSFEGMTVDIKGRGASFSSAPDFALTMALATKSPQSFVRWSGAELDVETRDLGQLALSGSLKGSFDALEMDLKGQALRATFTTRGTIQAPFDNPGDMALRYSLKHPSHLDMIRRLKLPLKLVGKSKPFDITGAMDGPWNSFDLTSNVTALGGKLGWAGIIKTDAANIAIEGNFDIDHPDLTQLLKSLNVGFTPSDPKKIGGTRLTGHIEGNQDNFTLTKLGGTLGKSRVEGALSIQPLNPRQPQNGNKNVSGRVSVSSITLSDYFSRTTTGVRAAKKAGGKRWADTPLGWNWLAKHQLTFALQADQLLYGNYEMKDLSLGLSLKDGVLKTTELAALLFDGQLSGETTLNLKRVPSLTQTFSLKNAKLSPLMMAATGLNTLSGTLNLSGNFSANGDTQQGMINSLNGTGSFAATDGVIRGLNLSKLSADIPTVINLPSFVRVLGGSLGKGQTAMKSLTATLSATKGIISAPDIKGDLDKSALTGNLTLDLPKWTMNGSGRLALTEPANLPGIGATISGSFSNPKKKFNTTEITGYMAKKLTQKMLEKLLKPSTPKSTTQNPASDGANNPTAVPPTTEGSTATDQAPDTTKAKTPQDKAKALLKGIKSLIDKNKKKPAATDPKTPAPKT